MLFRPGNNMISMRNHPLYHFSTKIYFHFASFTRQNTFEKLARGNAVRINY